MISNRNCLSQGCNGALRSTQTGNYMNDTKVARLKCVKCGQSFCSVQFIGPPELMKWVTIAKGNKKVKTIKLRHPITVDLDPDLAPEIKVHYPKAIDDPWK